MKTSKPRFIVLALAIFALCFIGCPKYSFAQDQQQQEQTQQEQTAQPTAEQIAAQQQAEVDAAAAQAEQEQLQAQQQAEEEQAAQAEADAAAQVEQQQAEQDPQKPSPSAPVQEAKDVPVLKKRDEEDLAEETLDKSGAQEKVAGETSELHTLLAKAEAARDNAAAFGRHELVALRLHLQRFRNQSDEIARRVDEEVQHLEKVIAGIPDRSPGQNITGQTRNL